MGSGLLNGNIWNIKRGMQQVQQLLFCLSFHTFLGLFWREVIFIEHLLYVPHFINRILFNSHNNSEVVRSRSKFCGV